MSISDGFWIGGVAARRSLRRTLKETEAAKSSSVFSERVGALVTRASAYYSCSSRGLNPRLLRKARCYMWDTLEAIGDDLSWLSPDQCDVLATIAMASSGGNTNSPLPELARSLASTGFLAWERREKCPPHTGALLALDAAEAMVGQPGYALRTVRAFCAARGIAMQMEEDINNLSIHEQQQLCRIERRLGVLLWRWKHRVEARRYFRKAMVLARQHSPDQVQKIRLTRIRLWFGNL